MSWLREAASGRLYQLRLSSGTVGSDAEQPGDALEVFCATSPVMSPAALNTRRERRERLSARFAIGGRRSGMAASVASWSISSM